MWDEGMESHIYIYIYIGREREREKKKKPIQIWFSWIGKVVVSQIHKWKNELLGWMEKCFFIHPQR
jgi:hypothetical protein